jgi:hypothetical protein
MLQTLSTLFSNKNSGGTLDKAAVETAVSAMPLSYGIYTENGKELFW